MELQQLVRPPDYLLSTLSSLASSPHVLLNCTLKSYLTLLRDPVCLSRASALQCPLFTHPPAPGDRYTQLYFQGSHRGWKDHSVIRSTLCSHGRLSSHLNTHIEHLTTAKGIRHLWPLYIHVCIPTEVLTYLPFKIIQINLLERGKGDIFIFIQQRYVVRVITYKSQRHRDVYHIRYSSLYL